MSPLPECRATFTSPEVDARPNDDDLPCFHLFHLGFVRTLSAKDIGPKQQKIFAYSLANGSNESRPKLDANVFHW